jgi:hypothetical protein
MTELFVRGDSFDKALSEGREQFDLDIDILNGYPKQLNGSANAEKQRAYIATYTKKGSMPLAPDEGIDWADFASGSKQFVEIVTQIQKRLADHIGIGKFAAQLKEEDGILKIGLIDLRG